MVKFGVTIWNWDSLPQAKFCKKKIIAYRELPIPPLGEIYEMDNNSA